MTDHKEHLPKNSKQKPTKRLNAYAKFSGVAFQMIAIICLGTFGGVKLDEKFPNDHSLFTIIVSLTAVVIAMYYVIKQVTNTSNKKNKK